MAKDISVTPLREAGFNLLLFLLSLMLYFNTFDGGYVWDDRAAIISNRDVHQETTLTELLSHDFWGQNIRDTLSHKSYRPVTVLSFRINHMLHGLHSGGYHVTNVVIYGFVTVLSYQLAKVWMTKRAARIASLLFCVHPVHVEAVASLVGRADSLCGFFYILAMLIYVESLGGAGIFDKGGVPKQESRQKPLYFGFAILLGGFASFSKEIGVTVFAAFFALEVAMCLSARKRLKGSATSLWGGFCMGFGAVLDSLTPKTVNMARCSILFVSLAVLMKVRTAINGETTIYEWTKLENHIHHLPHFQERALSYGQSHFWYFFKLFFPRYLCFDYGFACIPTIHSIWDLRNLLPLLAYGTVLFVVCVAIRRVNVSLLLGLVMFIVPLLPALNIFLPVGTILAERLLFLPSLGFCFVLGELLSGPDFSHVWQSWEISLMFLQKSGSKRKIRVPNGANLNAFIGVLCCLAAIRVVTRNRDWNSELKIYQSALDVCPLSAKALANYAVLSLRDKTIHKSLISALTATDIYKEQAPAFLNTGVVLQKLGFHARSAWYYEQSLDRRGGQRGKSWGYLGSTLYEWSLHARETLDSAALDTDGGLTQPSVLLQRMARDALDEAIRHDFQSPSLYHTRGSLAIDQADLDYAVACFEIALKKTQNARAAASAIPREDLADETLTLNQLGNALSQLGRHTEAVAAFQRGLEIDRSRGGTGQEALSILVNMGSTLRLMGQLERARDVLSEGVTDFEQRGNALPSALLNNLGLVEQDLGNLEGAEKLLERAVAAHTKKDPSSRFFMRSTGEQGRGTDSIENTLLLNLEKLRTKIAEEMETATPLSI